MGNQCKKNHISNNERLFSQTFEFDKNAPEEIINTTDKIITQTNSINNNTNNIKSESPKNINTQNINNNHKHKKSIRQSLGLKRKRNVNNDFSQNEKIDGPKNP